MARGLLGLVVVAVLLASPALLVHAPRGAAWPRSPHEPSLPYPTARGPWNRGSLESLALLRRITAREARHADAALARCETRAGVRHGGRRLTAYRRCAIGELQRARAYAATNSRMLQQLVNSATPTRACRSRVLALSGSASLLAELARATVGGSFGVPWAQVLAASRSVRGLAREALRQARDEGWSTTCRPRPAAPQPPDGPVA